MAFKLEDQIEIFTEKSFNPEVAAQHFFSSNSEQDVSRKLNDMTVLHESIETVLKERVQQNYKVFLHANDEIKKIGLEMLELGELVDRTQDFLKVRSVHFSKRAHKH
jgi:hypothetical protein